MTALGTLSRALNRMTGGRLNESLCRRIAERFGPYCTFCKLVGIAVRDPDHCSKELDE